MMATTSPMCNAWKHVSRGFLAKVFAAALTNGHTIATVAR